MSNAQKPTDGAVSLDKYRKNLDKTPFRLKVDVDTMIEVEWPSSAALFDAEAALRDSDSRAFIAAVCGDAAEPILSLLAGEDFRVMQAVSTDIQKHFGLGN